MLSRVGRDVWRSVVVCSVMLASLIPLASPVAAQTHLQLHNTDLVVNAATHFDVDPAAGVVAVHTDYLLSNTSTEQRLTEFDELLLDVASDVSATSRGQTLDVLRIGAADGLATWRIQLPSALRPGRDVELSLTWSIAGGDPASGAYETLINAAYVSFPVVAVGGPGGEHSVDVTLPRGFRIVDAPGLTSTPSSDAVVLSDSGSLDTYAPVTVVATNPSALVPRRVADLDVAVDLLGWPGDAKWANEVTDAVGTIFPQLTEWLGMSPVETLEIREGSPDIYPELTPGMVVEGGTSLLVDWSPDLGLLGRQLAAVWLNGSLPEIDWVAAAAADVLGTRAAQVFDPLVEGPAADAADSNAVAYGVVDSLVGEIGESEFSQVMSLVADGAFTYPGPGAETIGPLPVDWRTLLDNLEGVGGSTQAANLFRRIETDPAHLSALDKRDSALIDLQSLEDLASGWALPIWIRLPLARWDFGTFEARLPVIENTLSQRDALSDEALAAEIDLGDFVRVAFESESHGMTVTDAAIADQVSALDRIVEAERVVDSNSGLISWIGLIGTDVAAKQSGIRASFESGSFDTTRELSDELVSTIEGSNAAGVLRVFIPGAILLLVGLGAGDLVRRRQGRSGSAAVEEMRESGT